jgi:hypothetical protein
VVLGCLLPTARAAAEILLEVPALLQQAQIDADGNVVMAPDEWGDFYPVPAAPNKRSLYFSVPTHFKTNASIYLYPDWSRQPLDWTGPTSYVKGTPPNDSAAFLGSVFAGVEMFPHSAAASTTPSNRIAQIIGTHPVVAPYADTELRMIVRGGAYDAQEVRLPAGRAIYVADSNDASTDRSQSLNLVLVVDLGIRPSASSSRVLMEIHINCGARSVTNPALIPFEEAATAMLGHATIQEFNLAVVNQLRAGFRIEGAIPEFLFLYDFSGRQSIRPDAVSFDRSNQYDLGKAFDLPVRWGAAGGNACGPTSLGLALEALGFPRSQAEFTNLFARTMTDPVPDPQRPGEFIRAFHWDRAKSWLNQQALGDVKAHAHGKTTPPQWSWDLVESELAAGRPVLLGTTLSSKAEPGESDGHVTLLLGMATNQLGAFYIVNDPAGHYFANPRQANHYGDTNTLRRLYLGANFGGHFALYPKEALRRRASGSLLHFQPVPELTLHFHSPILPVLTDPLGRRTGASPAGNLQEIPLSWYFRDSAQEFENANDFTLETQVIAVLSPVNGTYTLDLVGTGSGTYSIDFTREAPGTVTAELRRTGNTTPGETARISFTLNGASLVSQAAARPTLSGRKVSGPGYELTVAGDIGSVFQLQSSTNLVSWQDGGRLTNSSGSVKFLDMGLPAVQKRFYRVVVP